MKRTRVVIVGTGTGVGKTHVGCAILEAAASRGLDSVGLKPIESGVHALSGPDAAALAGAARREADRQPYALRDAVSPHLAARRQGVLIDLRVAANWVDSRSRGLTVVESAGGLLTPISESATNLDLVRALKPDRVVVVSLDRLGVLHDVAAVLLALNTFALGAATVVLNAPEAPDLSSGTNATEIARLHRSIVIEFPRALPHTATAGRAANSLLDLLL